MSGEERLGEIVASLRRCGVRYLVMGGHAVRYYGIGRNTIDYDLHLSMEVWDDLPKLLSDTGVLSDAIAAEGPSWRPNDFRRFMLGRLPDGREEWLEFWRRNHLLAPFDELYERCEEGIYGGSVTSFLALSDLIRSKQTERTSDWLDVDLLEEILDARNFARVGSDEQLTVALAQLRSRRGFDRATQLSAFNDSQIVRDAFRQSTTPLARAFLAPLVPSDVLAHDRGIIGEMLNGVLRREAHGSARHLALVEAVRRQFKQQAMEADRKDKAASLENL